MQEEMYKHSQIIECKDLEMYRKVAYGLTALILEVFPKEKYKEE